MNLASKKGFGLVEVMIAVGIMTVMALGFSQIMRFQAQGQSSVTANEETSSFQKILTYAMADYPTCHLQPFAGMAFSLGLPAASQPAVAVPGGTLKYTSGLPIISTVAPNNNLGDALTVTKIQIQPYAQVGPTTFTVLLQVLAQKKAGTVSGSNIFTTTVPISVQALPAGAVAVIQDCTNGAVCAPLATWKSVGIGSESFCISTSLQGPALLFNAVAACEGLNAHLCSSEEWLEACNFAGAAPWPGPGPGPVFDATTPQWIAPIYTGCGSPGCYELASNSGYAPQCIIGGSGGAGFNNPFNYRCCHK